MKSVCLMSRRPDLPREAFRDYYETRHAFLGMKHFAFRKYLRNHVVASSPAQLDFDCLSEFWQDDLADAYETLAGPIGEVVREDERRFTDRPRIRAAASVETLVAGPERGVERGVVRKQGLLLVREAGLAAMELARTARSWGERLARELPGVERVTLDEITRFDGDRSFPYDAILFLWLADGAPGATGLAPPADVSLAAVVTFDSIESPPELLAARGSPVYDEFALLRENADELGIAWRGAPRVERRFVPLPGGRQLSALVWGDAPPRLVLLHGGAQNAHTWDSVALALDLPLVAIDLPGHGHSDWREDHAYDPRTLAEDVTVAVRELAPDAELLCGMSLGGLTAIALAARAPELARRLVVVDVTPGTDHAKAEPIIAFVSGPESFDSFDSILERTLRFNPTRSVSSMRRGVLHNARELPDGRWTWRYDPMRSWRLAGGAPDFSALWEEVSRLRIPVLLVRGGVSGVVSEDDVAEFRRRQPAVHLAVVPGAGHSVQGDRPLELAALLREAMTFAT
jgi:uncharacterized protein (TIGR02118 family)